MRDAATRMRSCVSCFLVPRGLGRRLEVDAARFFFVGRLIVEGT